MKRRFSKLLALLMAVLMTFSIMPISASAADDLDGTAFMLKRDDVDYYGDIFAYVNGTPSNDTTDNPDQMNGDSLDDINDYAQWRYTFYLESAGNDKYYIYVQNGTTKYYVYCGRITSNNSARTAYSVDVNDGKYTFYRDTKTYGRLYLSLYISRLNGRPWVDDETIDRGTYGSPIESYYTITYSWSGDVPSSVTKPSSQTNLSNGWHAVDGTYCANYKVENTYEEYVFSGWKVNGTGSVVTAVKINGADIELKGTWTRNAKQTGTGTPQTQYTVEFDLNYDDATGAPVDQLINDGGYVTEPAPAPTRDNYTFTGWYTDDDCDDEDKWDFDEDTVTSNMTLYAGWEADEYDVTFYPGTDATLTVSSTGYTNSAPYTEQVAYGETATDPGTPTRDGYRFEGWYTAATGGEEFDFDTAITADTDVYGQWSKVWKITYNHGDGSVTHGTDSYTGTNYYVDEVENGASYSVGTGITVTPPTGHSFADWGTYDTNGNFTPVYYITSVVEDQTLYARYTTNGYTVTFDTNGGTLTVGTTIWPQGDTKYTQTVAYGGNAAEPANDPTRDGYVFRGWFDTETSYETPFDFDTEITGDLVLTAFWTQNCDVTFYPGTGDGTKATLTVGTDSYTDDAPYVDSVTAGETTSNPGTPVLSGHRFLGWYTAATGGTTFDFSAQITEDTEVYGRWMKVYNITYNHGDGSVAHGTDSYTGTNYFVDKVDAGANYTVGTGITVTPPAGHEFGGWGIYIDGLFDPVIYFNNVTSDQTVYARYTPINYTVTYDAAGGKHTVGGVEYPTTEGVKYSEQVAYNTAADAISDPTRLGYTFDGWFYMKNSVETSFVPGTTKVYSDIDVYAKWTENRATISYTTNTVGDAPDGYTTGTVSPASETIGVVTGTPVGSTAAAADYYEFTGWYYDGSKVSSEATLTKAVIDSYAKDADGLYKASTFTAHFTERSYDVEISKTVKRSMSSEKPGRVSFRIGVGAIEAAEPYSLDDITDSEYITAIEVATNGVGSYTDTIKIKSSMLAGCDADYTFVIGEVNDGTRYWRYDKTIYTVAFDPDSDAVVIASAEEDVEVAAFTNSYSRVEDDGPDRGYVEVIKIDEDDEETYLEGAKFKLYEADTDRLVSAFETDEDGRDTSKVPVGSYYLIESASPEGYTRDTDPIKVTVKADKTTTVYVTNKKTETPNSLNNIDHYAYIVGYPDGSVRPQGSITRAEVATIFFRLLTDDVRNEYITDTNSYSDVNPDDWFCTAVSTLSKMGIINGYTDGTFNPGGYITRAEFAAIAARFERNGNTTEADFSDIYTHWAKKEISISANNGWILGYEDGSFRPNQLITRAEAMTLVNRVLNRVPEDESDLLRGMAEWTDNLDSAKWYYLAVQEATNSHDYERKDNGYETWIELLPNPDWSQFER